jgi:hypothetical protein
MIWLSPNEGHLHQTNVTIRLLRINLGHVTRIFVITGWRFELVAASDRCNQSVCMLQKLLFRREKVKESNGHVYGLPWGNSKNVQNPMRNFQRCTKSHDWLRIMHTIPWGTSKMYTIPWGTLKYAQYHEELPKLHKITWLTSNNAQNPMRNFRKCTKSHDDLLKMHKIPWLTSNNAQNPTSNFHKCKQSH